MDMNIKYMCYFIKEKVCNLFINEGKTFKKLLVPKSSISSPYFCESNDSCSQCLYTIVKKYYINI